MTVSVTMTTEVAQSELENRRTEVVAEEQKVVVESGGNPQKLTTTVDTKARKAVR